MLEINGSREYWIIFLLQDAWMVTFHQAVTSDGILKPGVV